MKKKLILVTLLVAVATAGAFAFIDMREIVATGTPETKSGTLVYGAGNWYVNVDGTLYQIHVGPPRFLEEQGVVLHDKDKVTIEGYFAYTHVIPRTLKIGNKTVEFLDENGIPVWRDEMGRGHDGDCPRDFDRDRGGRGYHDGRGGKGQGGKGCF